MYVQQRIALKCMCFIKYEVKMANATVCHLRQSAMTMATITSAQIVFLVISHTNAYV